jgi:hypothetical protein
MTGPHWARWVFAVLFAAAGVFLLGADARCVEGAVDHEDMRWCRERYRAPIDGARDVRHVRAAVDPHSAGILGRGDWRAQRLARLPAVQDRPKPGT